MQRSVVPFVISGWLIVGGILLAMGNPDLTQHALTMLLPLTLMAMGLWAIVRALRLHQLRQELPSSVLGKEVLLVVLLLIAYAVAQKALAVGRFARLRESIQAEQLRPIPLPPGMPVDQLPQQPRLVMVRQVDFHRPLRLDILGSDRFSGEGPSLRWVALSPEIVRLEVQPSENLLQVTVPKKVDLDVEALSVAQLTLRDIEGSVRLVYGYGGANPLVSIAVKGNITVRQSGWYGQGPFPAPAAPATWRRDELTLLPGPNSRIRVTAHSETVRIYALHPPQQAWDVHLRTGRIEVQLPANASVKLHATVSEGEILSPFGEGRRGQGPVGEGYEPGVGYPPGVPGRPYPGEYREHTGTLGGGKVPVRLHVGRGTILVEVSQSTAP